MSEGLSVVVLVDATYNAKYVDTLLGGEGPVKDGDSDQSNQNKYGHVYAKGVIIEQ